MITRSGFLLTNRENKAGQPLGFQALLCEVRGDWKFYKECFNFPGWNTVSGICWHCDCTPAELREVGPDAGWRNRRLSHWDLIHRIRRNNVEVSPLFSSPFLKGSCFKIDWLHAVDQGVGADFLGNFFYYVVRELLEGANLTERCSSLWMKIQAYYRRHEVQDRLQLLRFSMLRKEKASPKLRASAAEARALIPFALELANEVLDDANPFHAAMKSAAYHLLQCYKSLSKESIFWEDVLRTSSRKFAAQYIALEMATDTPKTWVVKPKMHVFLELCSSGSQPSLFWTYRDEDFGGACARWSRRRGGLLRPWPCSSGLLDRFRMRHPVPRIR